jgi:hypothetical protein
MSYNNSTYIGIRKQVSSTYINSSPRYQKRKEKKIHVRWLGHAH